MFLIFPLFYLLLKAIYFKMTQRGYHLCRTMSQDLDNSQVQNEEQKKEEEGNKKKKKTV